MIWKRKLESHVGILVVLSLAVLTTDVTGGPLDSTSCTLPAHFQCSNGECIDKQLHCNGKKDCSDDSDEQNCDHGDCPLPLWFRCNSGACLTSLYRCDGDHDCPDGSDEAHCSGDYKQDKPLECERNERKCADGLQCIREELFCDGEMDCMDSSDEDNCTTVACQGFRCDNGHCIIKPWTCDGVNDCGDNSDEIACWDEDLVCEMKHGRYLCADNSSCIQHEKVCDKTPDCTDGSDEGGECNNPDKNCVHANCKGGCLNSPAGAVCFCPPGYNETVGDPHGCQDFDECQTPHRCSHTCLNLPGTYQCECQEGYKLQNDNRTCRVNDGEAVMVFSTLNHIRALNLPSERYYTVSRKVKKANGVDFDGTYVYWTETGQGDEGLVRSFLNGTDKETLMKTGVGWLEDVAVDWLTGNLYFTDEQLQHIGVCANDGLHCVILFSRTIHKPRAVVLHPLIGRMYWTDWGDRPQIVAADMDGTEDLVIVRTELMWPNGLTIDYPSNRLYWVDGHYSKLETANLDGTDRKVVLHNIHRPYWISVFEDNLYWSDWETKSIQTCNKFTGKDQRQIIMAEDIFGMDIYHPALKPKKPHACERAQCSHICLLKGNHSHSCACPEDQALQRDGVSCKAVTKVQSLIMSAGSDLMIVRHQILGKHDVTIHPTPFLSIDCLAYDRIGGRVFVADASQGAVYVIENFAEENEVVLKMADTDIGHIDGMDFDYVTGLLYWCDVSRGTVEVFSPATRQRATIIGDLKGDAAIDIALVPEFGFMFVAFRTLSGAIHIDRMGMDGKDQTIVIEHGLDGPIVRLCYDPDSMLVFISDLRIGKIERMHIEGVGREGFREMNGHPVSLAVLGDIVFWTQFASSRLYWTAKSDMERRVIKKVTVELKNPGLRMQLIAVKGPPLAHSLMHECHSNSSSTHMNACSHICVQSDRTRHANAGVTANDKDRIASHTCLCPAPLLLGSDGSRCVERVKCGAGHFTCEKSNLCVDHDRRCDGKKDCIGGEDEEGCQDHANCKEDEFLCKNGQCIDRLLRCDKHFDCRDNSDELDCEDFDSSARCEKDQFECRNGQCLSTNEMCDGVPNCEDGEDEEGCAERTCGPDMFRCTTLHNCIPRTWECDGDPDCADGSDEHNKCAYNKPCPAGLFHCRSGKCIEARLYCDKMDDCGDGSDEMDCITPKIIADAAKECKDEEYACETDARICLPYSAKCNGTAECPRGEDEASCRICSLGEWPCGSNIDGSPRDHPGDSVFSAEISHPGDSSRGNRVPRTGRQQCIQEAWRCDGSVDCLDKSDEEPLMCKELKEHPNMTVTHMEVHKEPCEGGFSCKTGQCIDYLEVCNGFDNCYDGSDEGGLCGKSCENSICAEVCHKTPRGAVCACHGGGILAADGRTCDLPSLPCLASPAPCPHLCYPSRNYSYRCECFSGYMLRRDKKTCKAVGEPMSVVFAANTDIKRMTPHNNTIHLVHKENSPKISGLDVFSTRHYVFYSVEALSEIHHLNLYGGKESIVEVPGKPILLRLDWLSENIYYVDNGENKKFVVCHMDRKKCASLQMVEDKKLVTAFVVDPINRLMFYALTAWGPVDHSHSMIYKADLDGTHIVKIVSDNLTLCSGLAIDYEKKLLYFSDQQENKIETINYEATDRQLLLKDNTYIIKPYKLDLFEEEIYFTSFGTMKLTRCKVFGEKKCMATNLHVYGADFFKLDQTSKQMNLRDECRIYNCSNICVMAPLGPKCLCSDQTAVAPGVECNSANQADMTPAKFRVTPMAGNSQNSVPTKPATKEGKGTVVLLVLFGVAFVLFIALVLVRMKFFEHKLTAPNFQVHFSNPTFNAIRNPLSHFRAAKEGPSILRPNESEYENPLAPTLDRGWPSDLDSTNIRMTQKLPGGQAPVPNLLVDSDSDVESDRDLHDGDYRDEAKLLL